MPEKDQTLFQLTDRRSSTSLQAMEHWEVLPCPHCHLVQFRTRNLLCRRCHKPLDVTVKLPLRPDPVASTQGNTNETGSEIGRHLGMRVREVRKMRGLSQNALSHRMKVPRTYISRVEMNRTVPTIATLHRIANALEIQVYELLCEDAWTPQSVRAVTSDDPFLEEIALLSKDLNSQQRAFILQAVRDAAIRHNTVA